MAPDGRRHRPGVMAALRAAPRRFQLLAAVRVLEAAGVRHVRFRAPLAPVFPPGDVEDVKEEATGPVIETGAMALFGPNAPLPATLAEAVHRRARRGGGTGAEDAGPRAFFDLFGNRLVRAFVDLLRLEHPAAARGEPAVTPMAQALRALAGRAEPAADAPGFDQALLATAGLLHPRPLDLHAAGKALSAALEVPGRVEGLAGSWTPLAARDRSPLGKARLGTATLGRRVWLQEGRVMVHLGPMDATAFAALLPGGARHGLLRALATHALPPEADIDCRLTLAAADRPQARLGASRLGWSAWLGSADGHDGTAAFSLRGAA